MAEQKLFGVPATETPLFGEPVPAAEEEYDPEAYEGKFKEFGEGVLSGGTKLVQGVAELGALASDALTGTDYHDDVVQGFEEFRSSLGIDPQGLAGTIGEVGVQFVLPGAMAAKAVGGLSAVAKAGTTGKFLSQLGAAGVADAVTATNDTTTIGDFFEGGPTQTADLVGVDAEDRAIQGLINKLKVGVEGAAGVVAAPFIAQGAAKVAGTALDAAESIPYLPEAARAVKGQTEKVGEYFGGIEEARRMGEEQGVFKNAVADTLSTLRYRGILPEEVGEARSLISGVSQAEANAAEKLTRVLDKDINRILEKANKATGDASPLTRDNILNDIDKFLTMPNRTKAVKHFDALPTELKNPVRIMRTHLDELSEKILDSDFIKQNDFIQKETGKTLSETIRGNLGSYMRRRYRIFEDANYKPDDAVMREAVKRFKGDAPAVQRELEMMTKSGRYTKEQLGLGDDLQLLGQVTNEQATLARDNFLRRYKKRVQPSVKGFGRVADQRLNTNLFISKQNLKDYQKALLGEVKNPLENYVATVADMAEFTAVDDYFGKIRRLAETEPGIQKLFRKVPQNATDEQLDFLREEGFVVLGSKDANSFGKESADDIMSSGWGSLHGYAVPERVYKDLTRTVIGDVNTASQIAKSSYSGFLKLKGAAQYGKTILSPVTQVRNVTTASAFALSQGNVGKGANLWESVDLVFKNLKDAPPEVAQKRFKKLQELGVVNSQAELRELQELVSKGFGYADDQTVQGLPTARRVGSKLTDNPIGGWVRGGLKKSENLYQAGDDIWKVYNFTFESSKLRNALGKMSPEEQTAYIRRRTGKSMSADDFIDEEAARIVRNTVPNYNLAPEAIKSLRKLPVGNFIAFPFEIMRTGVNTVARGLDELADESVEIQKIGLRRLTGALTTFAVIPATVSQLGYALSGVSKEEMQAYQRSLAPPWERNARLIPIGRQDDGTPQYINFSYSNPYDMLERTVIAALNKFDEGRALGKNGTQIAVEAGLESVGELLAPFTEESIVTAKFRDVLNPETKVAGVRQLAQLVGGRGGRTSTGAKVYNEQDSAGDIVWKSFAHISDAIIPSVVPVDVRSGEYEPSRFARGFINSLGLEEETGISSKDRMGRERQLSDELFRAFTGITESDTKASEAIKYKGYEFSRDRISSSNIFNSVARRQNVTKDQLLEAYRDADNARYRVFNQFHQTIEDLRSFGMPDNKIRKVLKDAGVGGINELMRGRYKPLDISDSVLKDMRRNGTINQLPRKEIRSIITQQRSRKFGRQNNNTKLFGEPAN